MKGRKAEIIHDDDIIQNTMFIRTNLSIFTRSQLTHSICTCIQSNCYDCSSLSLQSDNNNGLCQCCCMSYGYNLLALNICYVYKDCKKEEDRHFYAMRRRCLCLLDSPFTYTQSYFLFLS